MNDQALIEKIEEYLSGQLDAQDKATFEAQIDQDPELKADIDSYRKANSVIEYAWKKDQKANLRKIDRELDQEQIQTASIRKMPVWKKIAVAAGLIFAIGTIGLLKQSDKFSSSESYAQLHMENVLDNSISRGGDTPKSPLNDLKKGIIAFHDNKYYLADEHFMQLLNGVESFYQQDAELFLAESYRQQGKMKAFKDLIQTIADDPNHSHFKFAKKELKGLK